MAKKKKQLEERDGSYGMEGVGNNSSLSLRDFTRAQVKAKPSFKKKSFLG